MIVSDERLGNGAFIFWGERIRGSTNVRIAYTCGCTRTVTTNSARRLRQSKTGRCWTCHRFSDRANWKGGRNITVQGYVLLHVGNVPDKDKHLVKSEKLHSRSYVFEHRYVLAKKIGRALAKGETVHHKNGVRSDNRPFNLELRSGPHGKGATVKKVKCPDCGHSFYPKG